MFFIIFLGMSLNFKYCGMYFVCSSSTPGSDVEVEPGRDCLRCKHGDQISSPINHSPGDSMRDLLIS